MKPASSLTIGLLAAASWLVPLGANAQTTGLGFNTLPPCRILDTRTSIGGALVAGVPQSVSLLSANLSSQGGSPTGCGVPATATGAMLNFTATQPAGEGFIVAWAYGSGQPSSSILNYGPVAGLSAIANGIAVPICNPSCPLELNVVAGVQSTHLIVDVVGYFSPAPLAPTGPQGPPGLVGAQGSSGAQGSQGSQGGAGAGGPAGAKGATGPAGTSGTRGPTGPVGPQGPLGAPVRTTAMCQNNVPGSRPSGNAFSYCSTVCAGASKTSSGQYSNCTASSQTGSCTAGECQTPGSCAQLYYGVCCVCRP